MNKEIVEIVAKTMNDTGMTTEAQISILLWVIGIMIFIIGVFALKFFKDIKKSVKTKVEIIDDNTKKIEVNKKDIKTFSELLDDLRTSVEQNREITKDMLAELGDGFNNLENNFNKVSTELQLIKQKQDSNMCPVK